MTVVLVTSLVGCNYKVTKQQDAADSNVDNLNNDNSNTPLSYSVVSDKVLSKNCVGCHSATGGNKGHINLESYENVKSNIAKIRDEVANKTMPPRKKLNDSDINLILKWIDAGATEDGSAVLTPDPAPTTPTPLPPPAPPTTPAPPVIQIPEDPKEITFAMVKTVLLEPKCLKCHSEAGGNKGDVNLETYQNMILNIQDAWDDLTDGSMPRGSDKTLTNDQKNIFFRWYDAGHLEFGSATQPDTK